MYVLYAVNYMCRYSPQELRCLPVNTVLEKVQVELQSEMPISSSATISVTTSSIAVAVSSIRSRNDSNPSSSVDKVQETDSVTSTKVIIHLQLYIRACLLIFNRYFQLNCSYFKNPLNGFRNASLLQY